MREGWRRGARKSELPPPPGKQSLVINSKSWLLQEVEVHAPAKIKDSPRQARSCGWGLQGSCVSPQLIRKRDSLKQASVIVHSGEVSSQGSSFISQHQSTSGHDFLSRFCQDYFDIKLFALRGIPDERVSNLISDSQDTV
jgi:hypothetical protein